MAGVIFIDWDIFDVIRHPVPSLSANYTKSPRGSSCADFALRYLTGGRSPKEVQSTPLGALEHDGLRRGSLFVFVHDP